MTPKEALNFDLNFEETEFRYCPVIYILNATDNILQSDSAMERYVMRSVNANMTAKSICTDVITSRWPKSSKKEQEKITDIVSWHVERALKYLVKAKLLVQTDGNKDKYELSEVGMTAVKMDKAQSEVLELMDLLTTKGHGDNIKPKFESAKEEELNVTLYGHPEWLKPEWYKNSVEWIVSYNHNQYPGLGLMQQRFVLEHAAKTYMFGDKVKPYLDKYLKKVASYNGF